MPPRYLTSVPSDEEIREKLIGCAGYSPLMPDKAAAAVAVSVILPHDDQAWAMKYLTSKGEFGYTSDCALFASYFYQLAVLGMETKNNTTPYRGQMGEVFSDMIQNAQEFGAWTTSRAELLKPPECGDLVHIGDGLATHVDCVTGFDEKTGVASVVAGGQVDNTWIMERERQWKANGTFATMGSRTVRGIQRIRLLRAGVLIGLNAANEVADTDRPPT